MRSDHISASQVLQAGQGLFISPTGIMPKLANQIGDLAIARTVRSWAMARDRKSTRLNSSHFVPSRMPSSA